MFGILGINVFFTLKSEDKKCNAIFIPKSFYDLDCIIEINESRLEQYTSAYQKVLERLTNVILIYSALTIF